MDPAVKTLPKNKTKTENFLFVSYDALISDTAWQVTKEGHRVKFYIQRPSEQPICDGLVPKTSDWRKEIDWADVIVFDDVLGQGREAQKLRERGKAVIGGTPYTDQLEDDRAFGQEELKKAGVAIIPQQNFSSFAQAIAFVKKHPGKYVVKPSGEAQNYKQLLFVGQEDDGKDVIEVLEHYQKIWGSKIKEFQLQRKIIGVEVAVGAFFNGYEFIFPININFEHKKMFPGDIGPSTGEMGTSMFWSGPNRLFAATLQKMKPALRRENYVGYIDINCIANNNGIYPLEFTARFGYPTISIQQEGMITPIGQFLAGLARGERPALRVHKGFQVGVRILVPPYPFLDKTSFDTSSRDAVVVFKKPNREGIHLEDIKKVKDDWVVTGHAGVALVAVGCGQTMKQAKQRAYNKVNNIILPNMYYRTDIGDRWEEDRDKLHNWGYLY